MYQAKADSPKETGSRDTEFSVFQFCASVSASYCFRKKTHASINPAQKSWRCAKTGSSGALAKALSIFLLKLVINIYHCWILSGRVDINLNMKNLKLRANFRIFGLDKINHFSPRANLKFMSVFRNEKTERFEFFFVSTRFCFHGSELNVKFADPFRNIFLKDL